MAAVTIRNLSDETHRALKVRATPHNRSTEAEIRAILGADVFFYIRFDAERTRRPPVPPFNPDAAPGPDS